MANTKLPSRLLDTSAIPALNVTGDLTVDTTTLKVDSTNNRVGIGIASPDAKLRIDQDVGTVGLKVTGGSGGTNIAEFIRDVGATTTVGINGSGAEPQMYFTSTANTFAIGVNGSNFEIADNATIGTNSRLTIDTAGNVGIGLSSGISSKLHVNAEMSLGADADNRAILGYASNAFTIGTRESSTNYFSTVTVTGGNVGIGLTPTDFANRKSLDIGLGGKIWGHTSATETGIGSNFYFDGAYKRTSANAATRHIQDGNGHTFEVAVSGSSDATISWLNALSIDSSGNTVFNSGGVDQDFTIKSNNSSLALYIDGANDYISFGNNAVNVASGYADQSGVGIHCLDGYMQISADSTPLTTGRTSTAGRGRHIIMRNASSVVGSIGDYNGVPYIGYDNAAGGGIMFNGTSVEPMGLAGARQTNINDLGSSNYRWKDGYFSNAVQAKSFERIWNSLDMTALDMGYFYPVGLENGSSQILQSFELWKHYASSNPTVGGAIQYGAVSMKMDMGGMSWGGNVIHNYLHHYGSQYRCMLGAITLRGYYRPVLWLRGGYGYSWTSNNPNITPTVYTTNTSFYNSPYNYTIGRITDSVMQGKSGYLGTTHKYGIVAEDTNCNNWYT